jgi:hypothetical protein
MGTSRIQSSSKQTNMKLFKITTVINNPAQGLCAGVAMGSRHRRYPGDYGRLQRDTGGNATAR